MSEQSLASPPAITSQLPPLANSAGDVATANALTPLERLARYLSGEHGKSAATRSAYLADAQLLLELCEGRSLESLVPRDFRNFIGVMHKRGHDARSMARRLSAWRGWYRLLMREAGFSSNPVQNVRPPKRATKLPRPLDTDSMSAFLDHAPSDDALAIRDLAIYELLYSSGLRIAELVGIDLADFSEQGSVLRVVGKGNKMRVVPVGKQAQAAIKNWLTHRGLLAQADETALFLSQNGRRIGVRAVQLRLHDAGIQAGIADRMHPHKLRHACASHFLQSSQDLRATQELLGHASIESTQVYTHLDFQHLSAVYDVTHPRAKKRD